MTQQQNQTPQQPQQPAPQPQPMPQQPQQSPQPQPQPQNPQPMPQQAQPLPQQPQPLISFATTAPEPTQKPNAWDSIIAQQQEQINALMAQNQALTGQITQMVQGGAQFTSSHTGAPTQQPPQMQQAQQMQQMQQPTEFPPVYDGASPLAMFNPPALSDNQDYSLEGLASEIGKPADKN